MDIIANARESIKIQEAKKLGIYCDDPNKINLQIKSIGNNVAAVIAKNNLLSNSEFTSAKNQISTESIKKLNLREKEETNSSLFDIHNPIESDGN
jgi:hypothetical protein